MGETWDSSGLGPTSPDAVSSPLAAPVCRPWFLNPRPVPEPPEDVLIGRLEPSLVLQGYELMRDDDKDFDWDSDEGKEAHAQMERILELMDESAPEGAERQFTELGTDANGEPFGYFAWRKP